MAGGQDHKHCIHCSPSSASFLCSNPPLFRWTYLWVSLASWCVGTPWLRSLCWLTDIILVVDWIGETKGVSLAAMMLMTPIPNMFWWLIWLKNFYKFLPLCHYYNCINYESVRGKNGPKEVKWERTFQNSSLFSYGLCLMSLLPLPLFICIPLL